MDAKSWPCAGWVRVLLLLGIMWSVPGLHAQTPLPPNTYLPDALPPPILDDGLGAVKAPPVTKQIQERVSTKIQAPGPLPSPVPGPPGGAGAEATKDKQDIAPNKELEDILERPLDTKPDVVEIPPFEPYAASAPFQVDRDPPPGYTGNSSVAPREVQTEGHFVPVEDRWRVHPPCWDRYGKGHPLLDDYPYDVGHWWDPYHQNVLKGDYPILGQNTFMELTLRNITLIEPRQIPTATTPFESTANPYQQEFFGKPNQLPYLQFYEVNLDLFHGDAAFKPTDWRVRVGPVFNVNTLNVSELAVINPDVRRGVQRERNYFALQEVFVEKKIADLGPYYDFVSVRVGNQPFVSDFRGFIFNDINRGVRVFGTLDSNRYQFNAAYFNQLEKDTNSGLNTFSDRDQHIFIANLFRQDFIWPGFTVGGNVHYNRDQPRFLFDRNRFLVRPDPVGTFGRHGLDVVYLGLLSDGHINRINITSALYTALGRDSQNPLANRGQDISGYMSALELSYDRDYVRFRSSFFFSSGDGNVRNGRATGFDSILDNPNFAGTQFSYFQRQVVPLFGVALTNRLSIIPDLRSSKIQGQSNFVNPGLMLFNLGVDCDVTPKLKVITNYNLLWFDKTNSLETFVFQGNIDRFIGADLSVGVEYRPLLSNNVVMVFGCATLIPAEGFKDLYNRLGNDATALVAGFAQMTFQY